jgi:hypothetical protein
MQLAKQLLIVAGVTIAATALYNTVLVKYLP